MKNRFKIKKKLFDDKEIKELRQFLNTFPIINKSLALTSLSHYKPLYEIVLSEKIFNFIEETYNDDVFFYYDFVIQKNNRNFSRNTNYHKDSGKFHQSAIISKKNNLLFKVGICLQNNIENYGGGIDILKPFYLDKLSDNNKFINKLRAIYYYVQRKIINTQVYSETGDAIIFHALLNHRTTVTSEEYKNELEDKYVIYFQLLNLNLLKDVIKIVDKDGKYKNENDIKKNIITIRNQEKTFKILNREFTELISTYLGA